MPCPDGAVTGETQSHPRSFPVGNVHSESNHERRVWVISTGQVSWEFSKIPNHKKRKTLEGTVLDLKKLKKNAHKTEGVGRDWISDLGGGGGRNLQMTF